MIKKLHDEWEKLSEEARMPTDQDPERMKQIAERMNAVSTAMQKMSQASVTRTTLSQAVRDALKEILRNEPVLPEVAALREDLAMVRQLVEEKLSAPTPEPFSGKGLEARIDGVASSLVRLTGRIGTLEDSISTTGESLQGALAREIAAAGVKGAGEVRALEDRFAGFASSLERLTGRIGSLEDSLNSSSPNILKAIGEEMGTLESKTGGEVQALQDRFGGIASGLERLTGRIGSLEDSLNSSTPNILKVIAEEMGTLESKTGGEVQALQDRFGGIASGLERLTGRIGTIEAALASREITESGSREDEKVQALKDQFESGLEQLTGRIGTLEDSISTTGESLQGALAREITALGARGDGEVQALKDQFASFASGLDQLSSRVGGFEDSIPLFGKEVHRAIAEELAALESKSVGEIQGLQDRFAREFVALKDLIFERVTGVETRIAGGQEPRLVKLEEASLEARALVEELHARSGVLSEDLRGRAEGLEQELSRRIEEAASSLSGSAGELAAKFEDQATRLVALGQDLASADDHLAEGLKDLESRLGGRITTLEGDSASRLAAVEGSLQNNLAAAETRLTESQGLLETRFIGEVQDIAARIVDDLSGRIAKLEEALPELRGMEERLQTEMEIAMDQIVERVNSLVEMVGQIQTTLPPREVFTGMDERLDRLETRFRSISDLLGDLEGTVPELRSLGDRMAGVREEISSLLHEFSSGQKDAHGASELFARKVQDLQDLLRSLLERWNADRSNFRQRLVDLRDTLRDQLQAAIHASDGIQSQNTFWGKLMAKPDGGLRFGMEEWERFRARLETILQGLESLVGEAK